MLYSAVSESRKEANITQEELAHLVGVSRQTIIAIEKGNYTPSVALALKLASALQKSVEQLFTLEEDNAQAS